MLIQLGDSYNNLQCTYFIPICEKNLLSPGHNNPLLMFEFLNHKKTNSICDKHKYMQNNIILTFSRSISTYM